MDLDGPIRSLPIEALRPLCTRLSVDNTLGHDWRELAGYIGLPFEIIALIEKSRDTLKAYKLIDLWDTGIKKNPGTVRKFVVALTECKFPGYMAEFQRNLNGLVDFNEIESYMARIRLQNGGVKALFPLLSVSDVVLDAQFERHCISCDIECEEEIQPFPSVCRSQVLPESIYVSHFSSSCCKMYKQQVTNMVKHFRIHGHKVWYSKRAWSIKGLRMSLSAWKQRHIEVADNIIVVLNQEYLYACDQRKLGNPVHPCVATDIPCIEQTGFNGGSSRIIPVVIDDCKNHCNRISSVLPAWLCGSVKPLPYPSQWMDLIHCVQRVKKYAVPEVAGPIRKVRPKELNFEEILRQAAIESEQSQ